MQMELSIHTDVKGVRVLGSALWEPSTGEAFTVVKLEVRGITITLFSLSPSQIELLGNEILRLSDDLHEKLQQITEAARAVSNSEVVIEELVNVQP